MTDGQKPALPKHVEEAVRQIADMHRDHHVEAKPMERLTDRAVSIIGTPTFFAALLVTVGLWMMFNSTPMTHPFDPPPFQILELLTSLVAILIAVLILAAQRRDDRLATRREQMNLQVSLATEQKVSKLIGLVEELRRDMPGVKDRVDLDAIEMTSTAGHKEALDTVDSDTTLSERPV
jgi:uncharacterized membrane protein